MIQSFKCAKTKRFFQGEYIKEFSGFEKSAQRKLLILASATGLRDLKAPPGNNLEALSGDRDGQHSIRINDQWRVCFRWTSQGPDDVEIVDYH